jgi:hypothetical protein
MRQPVASVWTFDALGMLFLICLARSATAPVSDERRASGLAHELGHRSHRGRRSRTGQTPKDLPEITGLAPW